MADHSNEDDQASEEFILRLIAQDLRAENQLQYGGVHADGSGSSCQLQQENVEDMDAYIMTSRADHQQREHSQHSLQSVGGYSTSPARISANGYQDDHNASNSTGNQPPHHQIHDVNAANIGGPNNGTNLHIPYSISGFEDDKEDTQEHINHADPSSFNSGFPSIRTEFPNKGTAPVRQANSISPRTLLSKDNPGFAFISKPQNTQRHSHSPAETQLSSPEVLITGRAPTPPLEPSPIPQNSYPTCTKSVTAEAGRYTGCALNANQEGQPNTMDWSLASYNVDRFEPPGLNDSSSHDMRAIWAKQEPTLSPYNAPQLNRQNRPLGVNQVHQGSLMPRDLSSNHLCSLNREPTNQSRLSGNGIDSEGTYDSRNAPVSQISVNGIRSSEMPPLPSLPKRSEREWPYTPPYGPPPQHRRPISSAVLGGLQTSKMLTPHRTPMSIPCHNNSISFTTRMFDGTDDRVTKLDSVFSKPGDPGVPDYLALADIRYPRVIYRGVMHTTITIPWPGKPGWVERDVDESFHDDYEEGFRGRRGRGGRYVPLSERIEQERRRKEEAVAIEIRIGEHETLDSIVEAMMEKESKDRKGKGRTIAL